MKRIIIAAVFLAAAVSLFAQEYDQKLLKNQGLTDDQITKLTAIQNQGREEIQKARADANVLKARLTQLLVGSNVDMSQVEKVVKEAADLDVKIKLAQIRQEIAVRKLLGDATWNRLTKALRQKKEAAQAKVEAEAQGAAEKPLAGRNLSKEQRDKALELLKELRQILGESQQ